MACGIFRSIRFANGSLPKDALYRMASTVHTAAMSSRLQIHVAPTTSASLPDDTRRRARDGQALMVAGGLLLGTVGVFVEEAGQHPATTVWFRCVFGLAALLAWGAVTGRLHEVTGLRGRDVGAVTAAGGLMVGSWGLFFAAIPLCSVALSTVVFHLQPFWLLVLGVLVLRERVRPAQWAAAAVALGGLALASGLADHEVDWWTQDSNQARGVALSLAGSLLYAGAAFIAKLQGERVSSFALSTGQCAVGALALAAWPVVNGMPPFGPAWAWLAGLGALHTGLAYVLVYAGMARLATGHIALLLFVYPLTAVLVDWAVYGRALTPRQLAGVALIGGALWTLRRRDAKRRHQTATP